MNPIDYDRHIQSQHLNQSLTAGTEGLKKGSTQYMGKVISNLGNQISSQIYRIDTLFRGGGWITNRSALDRIDKNITHISEKLMINAGTKEPEDLSPNDLLSMKKTIKEMQKVLGHLKKSEIGNTSPSEAEKNLNKKTQHIESQLDKLHKELEEKTVKESKKETDAEKNINKRDPTRHIKPNIGTGSDDLNDDRVIVEKMYSNFKKKISAQFYRMETLFEKGVWVTNSKVMNKVKKDFQNLKDEINKNPDIRSDGVKLASLETNLMKMETICNHLLKEGDFTILSKKEEELQDILTQIQDILTQIKKARKDLIPKRHRVVF